MTNASFFRFNKALSLLALGIALMLLSSPGIVPGALAKDGDVIKRGRCRNSRATWKLKLSPENGKIEVEFEVDQNRNGQTWSVVMKLNGRVFSRGKATTRAPSGSFEVRKLAPNGAGSDTIVAVAKRGRQVCVGRAVAAF